MTSLQLAACSIFSSRSLFNLLFKSTVYLQCKLKKSGNFLLKIMRLIKINKTDVKKTFMWPMLFSHAGVPL